MVTHTRTRPIETPESVAATIQEVLAGYPETLFAVLFGSVAEGRLTATSDVDVAIAGKKPLALETRLELMAALSIALEREVDLVDLNAADGLLLCEALPGRLLLNKEPELYAALLRRMWYFRADMLPIAQRSMDARLRKFLNVLMTLASIRPKLESLARCIARLASKLPPDAAALTEDFDRQDVLVLNLQRAVQLCVDIAATRVAWQGHDAPRTMAASFATLQRLGDLDAALAARLQQAVGLRHIAVHEYSRLDWSMLHVSLAAGLDDFAAFLRAALAWLDVPPRS